MSRKKVTSKTVKFNDQQWQILLALVNEQKEAETALKAARNQTMAFIANSRAMYNISNDLQFMVLGDKEVTFQRDQPQTPPQLKVEDGKSAS